MQSSEDDSTRRYQPEPKLHAQGENIPQGVSVFHYEGGSDRPLIEVIDVQVTDSNNKIGERN